MPSGCARRHFLLPDFLARTGESGVFGLEFESVVERGEAWGGVGRASGEGGFDEKVGDFGVFGEERAVEIGGDTVFIDSAFGLVCVVVPCSFDDGSERLKSR